MRLLNGAATFNEVTLDLGTDAGAVVEKVLASGVAAGVPLGAYYPGMERALVVTVTERRTRRQIERLAELVREAL